MFKRLLVSFVLLFGTLTVTTSAAAEKLTLMLDWFVNPDHGPIIIAADKGYFTEAGLEVEIIAPADPNDPPKLVAAGKAELAVSYQPQLHIQVDQGLPLVRIGTLISTPLNCLVVLQDGPIKSIADLKGKKIGFSVGGVEDALMTTMLAKHGLSLADVEMVNVNFSLSPSLITGKVDAVIGAYRNFELTQMDLENRPGRAFYIEEEGIPAYDELIFVAHRDKLDNPALKKFLAAIERATAFMINHPDEAWMIFKQRDKQLDDELNRRAWYDTLPRFALRPNAIDKGRYQAFATFLHKQKLIKTIPDLKQYALELPTP